MGISASFTTYGTAALAAAAFGVYASAQTQYGTFVGDTVTYSGVFEDDDVLFGAPTITGDTLSFSPAEFLARSDGGESNNPTPGPVDLVDGTLGFDLISNDGTGIDTFTLEESGAFALVGSGTEATSVAVSVVFSANILEVDGVAINGPSQVVSTTSLLNTNLVDSPGLGQAWIGQAEFDISALAASELGITGDITRARISLDNQLLAISEDGSSAFIDKKNIDGVVITVPEPASVALLALGGIAVLARRRHG